MNISISLKGVVIVGAGFAGLSLAKKNLKNKKFSRF
jgi:NADH dehydrogenase FAD-containing subunit